MILWPLRAGVNSALARRLSDIFFESIPERAEQAGKPPRHLIWRQAGVHQRALDRFGVLPLRRL